MKSTKATMRKFSAIVRNWPYPRTAPAFFAADLKAARFEALDIAKDELPDGDVRSFVIDIREGEGPIVLTASLSLRVKQKG